MNRTSRAEHSSGGQLEFADAVSNYSTLKICIYGAGAIGSWLGARLHKAGYPTTLIARGPHLERIQQDGLVITEAGTTENLKIPATSDVAELPTQDLIFVTLKAHSIPQVVPQIKHLMHEDSAVITAVNGIPWWFFYKLGDEFPERPVYSVDPEGQLWNEITPARTIGCVIYPSVSVDSPGVITHTSDNRLPIGEPDRTISERVERISAVLEDAGCKAPVRRNIRNEIWIKLMGNLAFNPLSVLENKTLDKLATEPKTREIASTLMQECHAVGQQYNARFGISIEKRLQGAANVGPHKTSMLQDYLRGRTLEGNSIIDGVIELADLEKVKVPNIRKTRSKLIEKLNHQNSVS